ncbi:MAG TPA: hypothetical protein VLH18_05435 [Candidatus Limnocylindrales bacterium]|nr:hypothetical protein [Candidatus Limnocylindrales bacterium]
MKRTNKVFLLLVVSLLISFSVAVVVPQEVEAATTKEAAILAARNAIAALPSFFDLTPADRAAVVEARRLVEVAKALGATDYDICALFARLEAAESAVGARPPATPPTGGSPYSIPAGLLLASMGAMALKKRKN